MTFLIGRVVGITARMVLTALLLGCIGAVLWFLGHGAGIVLGAIFGRLFN